MNNNKKVLILVLSVSFIYGICSFFNSFLIGYFPSFKNVNLIADITKEIPKKAKNKNLEQKKLPLLASTAYTNFEDYLKKDELIDFDNNSKSATLGNIAEKLLLLSENKNIKIRIAWFGDSQIEGDLITQDIRKMLQAYFHNHNGVGYLPIKSVSSDLRQSANIKTSDNVEVSNFKKGSAINNLFLSGYHFTSPNLTITAKDNTKKDSTQHLQKWLLFGKGDSIAVTYNGAIKKYAATKSFNRVLIDKLPSNKIYFEVQANKTPVYGISFEPEKGIVLDNFSFRGITGVELKKVQNQLLQQLNTEGYYDLIVFQYGVNLMFRANDTDYSYYQKIMNPVLDKYKKNLPKSKFLMLSCSDRAFRYNNQWESAVGIDSLIKTQAKLAFDNKIPFYNLFASMGGRGTMKKWCDTLPSLANKDYIHFNHRGAKKVAQIIFDVLIKDFKKSIKYQKKQKDKQQKDSIFKAKDHE
ncbi:hypothetical protein SL053_001573 [Flavobacterium psychrophilum]|uniref:hypothetical protein n=1 Tax=Flavobacterium psychrophilum TaxID=96345 RepID=UPI00073E2223|nr:hypothetical protein [Flavobacterium psychrophilum]EKT4499608.1 hypothetical protein [Flavobacterium psychrophilum]EKT4502008.1 hypothetical protein [Flavobacterium psychrophilum]EKT4548425.1 hypothetical protein [Flavobacterium psychrophilum]ELV7526076.1 hypothetical protein [Flavobacterium psychrophilum]ELY2017671.1 hypothetical protein [Flavobacterium psychrophilum]